MNIEGCESTRGITGIQGTTGISPCAALAGVTGPAISTPCAPICVLNVIIQNLQPLVAAGFLKITEGKYRSPEREDIDEDLRECPPEYYGVFSFDIKSSETRTQTTTGQLNIQGLLQVNLPSDVSTSMACAYTLAEMIKSAMAAEASFFACSSRPRLVTYVPVSDVEDDKIMQFEFQASYDTPMICVPL